MSDLLAACTRRPQTRAEWDEHERTTAALDRGRKLGALPQPGETIEAYAARLDAVALSQLQAEHEGKTPATPAGLAAIKRQAAQLGLEVADASMHRGEIEFRPRTDAAPGPRTTRFG
jgi:hypothetical protein